MYLDRALAYKRCLRRNQYFEEQQIRHRGSEYYANVKNREPKYYLSGFIIKTLFSKGITIEKWGTKIPTIKMFLKCLNEDWNMMTG